MATGRFAPWHLWILIVFWFLQLAILTFEIIVRAIALHADRTINSTSTLVAGVVVCVIAAILELLTVYEIILLTQCRLRPAFYMVMNCSKSIFWLGITVSGIVSAERIDHTSFNVVTVIILIVLFLFFIFPAIYGAIELVKERRHGTKGAYGGVQNTGVPAYGQRTGYELQNQGQTAY